MTENGKFSKNATSPLDDITLKMSFAERITALRNAKNLTQAAMAQAIGITLRGYQSYESESNPTMPSYESLVAIRNTFGISVEYLLGNVD
ncbi:MAG: helix-turn-helix domain-containing protein [Christensenellaceae bacterium]|nr:helix-turn-helix domain-containing protein [Christensenellaceae bacterium]